MKALYTAILLTFFFAAPLVTAQNTNTKEQNTGTKENVELFTSSNSGTTNGDGKSLRLSVTVEAPEYLLIKVGDEISKGEIIVDKHSERKRLSQQRSSIALQIKNLKAKQMPAPFTPKDISSPAPLPAANFLEEESQVAQANLKLQQAQSILNSRTPVLTSDNPEKRASMEKAEAALGASTEKVREQEELVKSIRDMDMSEPDIILHEEAKLKQFTREMEQLQSALQREQALMAAAGNEQQQQLQDLQIAVQVARSELQIAHGRLETARNNRKLTEYKATIETAQRIEEENRSKQLHSQQLTQHAQAIRDQEYQLAQLQIQLSAVEDKLAQIPIIRAPRSGIIRRIKPWTGNNGKYSTTITISSFNNNDDTEGTSSKSTRPFFTQGAQN